MITLIVIVIKNAKYTLILPTDIAGEFSVKKVIFLYVRSTRAVRNHTEIIMNQLVKLKSRFFL